MFLLMLQEGEREEVVTKDRVVEVILDEVVGVSYGMEAAGTGCGG